MKKLLTGFALLTPFTVLAAVCDTSELERIEQRYIGTAPDCIASGDSSSAMCGGARQASSDANVEVALLKESGCAFTEYHSDPHVLQLSKLVGALPDKSAIKAKNNTQKYDSTTACTDLILDITRQYDVSNLSLINVGGHPSEAFPIVVCTYLATRTTAYGNNHVTISATFNLSNSRYNLEIN